MRSAITIAVFAAVILTLAGCGGSAPDAPLQGQPEHNATTLPVDCGGGITCR